MAHPDKLALVLLYKSYHEVIQLFTIRARIIATGVRCPLNKIVYLVYSWATKRSLSEAIKDVDVGKKMGINVYQWCRDICSWSLINGPDIKLGGPGQVVEIDESVFTHQGKVSIYACNNIIILMH